MFRVYFFFAIIQLFYFPAPFTQRVNGSVPDPIEFNHANLHAFSLGRVARCALPCRQRIRIWQPVVVHPKILYFIQSHVDNCLAITPEPEPASLVATSTPYTTLRTYFTRLNGKMSSNFRLNVYIFAAPTSIDTKCVHEWNRFRSRSLGGAIIIIFDRMSARKQKESRK